MISEFAKEKVFWTKKMNLKLVRFIESRPNIWNPKHPKYTSLEWRDKTYNEFPLKYGNEFTGQAVKERWTNVRSTFANYLRKLNASKATGCEEYRVNWHLWEPCQFLMKVNRKNNQDPSTSEGFVKEENIEDQLPQVDLSWSTDNENSSEINDTNNSTCKILANNLVNLFKDYQNDPFGLDNSRNGKVGRLVAKNLSLMSSYEAASASRKIMEVLLLYDFNNPKNPNYSNSDNL